MEQQLINKIDIVIKSQEDNIKELENKKNIYNSNFKDKHFEIKDPNYQYYLEKYHYQFLVCDNKIKKAKLYINRCLAYQNYLKSLDKNNPFLEKECEYRYINDLQAETIFTFDSKISELDQKKKLETLTGKSWNASNEKEKLLNEKTKILNKFLNQDFIFNSEEIYTVYYLNYDVIDVAKNNYKGKSRKAS
jgi:hypothetical protein